MRPTHLRAFLAEDAKRQPAPASQARATAALKSFFRFLVDDEQLERDPVRPLRTPMKREALPDVLTMAELERLFAAPDRGDIWERHFRGRAERDRLLLALFAYASLRRSELLGLAWYDVDLSRRLLYVRKAKGGRQRVVPIHPALAHSSLLTTRRACRSSSKRSSSASRASRSTTRSSAKCSATTSPRPASASESG